MIFLGSEGYMIFPDYSSYYTFLGPKREPGPSGSVDGSPMMDLDQFQNWIAAVRSRRYRGSDGRHRAGAPQLVPGAPGEHRLRHRPHA